MMKHFWQFLFGVYVLIDGLSYLQRGDASVSWLPFMLITTSAIVIVGGMIKVFHEAK